MTLRVFNNLSIKEQAEAVWNGKFIEHRKTLTATITLYSLGSFFVEAWYNLDHSEFLKFHAFESQSLLRLFNIETKN